MRLVMAILALLVCGAGCGGGGGSSASPVNVAISPRSATTTLGHTQGFTVTVTGTSNTTVAWSVLEGPVGGSITSAGVYTAPAIAGTFYVVATSQADNTRGDMVPVVVQAGSAGGTIQ